MCRKSQSDSLSETAGTKSTKTRATISAYNQNFQQHMADYDVYDYKYSYPNGQRTPKPNNLNEIMEKLVQPRRSLSPSQFSETEYLEVEQADADVDNETLVINTVIPLIKGKNSHQKCRQQDFLFGNLAPLTDSTLVAQNQIDLSALALNHSTIKSATC